LEPGESRAALVGARSYDAVIDTLAFGAADAADLLAADAGHFTVISTASVYADAAGRGLETAGEAGFPDYPDRIAEDQARVAAGPGYSAGKVALEDALARAKAPVAVLRPGAVHGIGARHPREWWFVKRALDGRRRVPVLDGGRSVFHTSSTLGIAGLTRHCIARGLTGPFNAADPDPPSVAQIAAHIGGLMGFAFELVPVSAASGVGHSPWSAARPMRLSNARAVATGWDGGPHYGDCLPDYVAWMVAQAADWQQAFPVFGQYGHDPFDYAGEDAVQG
jgi:nucleoside-diphosphate-sugar epimerase